MARVLLTAYTEQNSSSDRAVVAGPLWVISSNPHLANLLPGCRLSSSERVFKANSGWAIPYFLLGNKDCSMPRCTITSCPSSPGVWTEALGAAPSWGEERGVKEEGEEARRAARRGGLKSTIDRLWRGTEQALGKQVEKKQLWVGSCKTNCGAEPSSQAFEGPRKQHVGAEEHSSKLEILCT